MSERLGDDSVVSYKVGGVSGGGSFVEIGKARDVTADLSYGEVDASSKEDAGDEAVIPGRRVISLTFDLLKDDEDESYTALRDAWANKTTLGIQNRDYDGGPGWQTDMKIFGFTDNQPLNDVQTVSVTMKRTKGADFTILEAS